MRGAKSIDMVIGIIRDGLIGMDFNDIVATLSNFGKAYVGFGESLDAENNSLQAVKNALKSPLFSYIDRAIKKHGWKNFSVEIIETCETLEQLNEREKFWIRELNCKKPNGYNLTDGGEGIPGYKAPPELSAKLSAQRKGRKISTEQSEKISATMTGREFTDEHKANISAAKMGHPVSDETRAKLAAAQTGKKASAATRAQMSASAAYKGSVKSFV